MLDFNAYAESLIDLTIRELGSLDALLVAALANGLSADAELSAGQAVRLPEAFAVPAGRRVVPRARPRSQLRRTAAQDGQSLIDLAVQEYGSVEGLLLLHQLNSFQHAQELPAAGRVLSIDNTATTNPTSVALLRRGIFVNTHNAVATEEGGQFNISQFNTSQFN